MHIKDLYRRTQALFHPERYHGWGRGRKFFEGWYYKMVSADRGHALAVIPGIAMDEKGEKAAFVQVLDGVKAEAVYHRFPADMFIPEGDRFELKIGGNGFSGEAISLDLPDLKGELFFRDPYPWPSRIWSPGIMGPYSFVPFMECYHGILSMDHRIEGRLTYRGNEIDFLNGRGYMEKDWGHSFPSAYIWLQGNHFKEPGVSLKCSVARIPWLGSAFNGFIAGFLIGGILYPFTTYNGSTLEEVLADERMIRILLKKGELMLEISVSRDRATELASPVAGFMDGRIEESMASEITVLLKNGKNIIFEGQTSMAAVEAAGDIPLLLKQ